MIYFFLSLIFQLNENTILQKLGLMSDEFHENNLKKLAEELSMSKKIFRNYSHQLSQEKQSEEILRQLTVMRNGMNETFNKLSSVVKNVLDKIGRIWGKVLPMMDNFKNVGYMSWLIGLVSCASTLVVTLFMLIPLSCTCCHVDSLAGISFVMSASMLSVFSVFLGSFVIFEALIGGHAEVFICRAFFEKPEFTIIGKLFDNPGIIYANPSTNGALVELLTPSELNSRTFSNTTLTNALGECENNKSSYETFQFENLLDLKNVLNFENYLDLATSINSIRAMDFPFISFTQSIQSIFDELIQDSHGNFTSYRMDLTQVSPEKEMNHFIDQMQRVSLQIQDVSTASRMATLASSARRIHSTILQPLEILKNEIIFQLTALELHIDPWINGVKEIKESFHESQKYLDNHLTNICANFSEHYRNRLRINLVIFRNETLQKLHEEFGCRPLFDTFNGIRWHLCGHIVDPINGEHQKAERQSFEIQIMFFRQDFSFCRSSSFVRGRC